MGPKQIVFLKRAHVDIADARGQKMSGQRVEAPNTEGVMRGGLAYIWGRKMNLVYSDTPDIAAGGKDVRRFSISSKSTSTQKKFTNCLYLNLNKLQPGSQAYCGQTAIAKYIDYYNR